jgi:hypothetical protein
MADIPKRHKGFNVTAAFEKPALAFGASAPAFFAFRHQ